MNGEGSLAPHMSKMNPYPREALRFSQKHLHFRKIECTNFAQNQKAVEGETERVGFEDTKIKEVEETQSLTARREFCLCLYDVVLGCRIFLVFAAS